MTSHVQGIRQLTTDEILRVDSLCLGPAHHQDHARWDPAALRRLLTQTTGPRWNPLRALRRRRDARRQTLSLLKAE